MTHKDFLDEDPEIRGIVDQIILSEEERRQLDERRGARDSASA
jgi:hypothetical protein